MRRNNKLYKPGVVLSFAAALFQVLWVPLAAAESYYQGSLLEDGGQYNSTYTPPPTGGTYGVPATMPPTGGSYYDTTTLPTTSGSYFDTNTLNDRFPNPGDEDLFHQGGSTEANTFFGSHITRGMKIPTHSAGSETQFEYKSWDGERNTESTENFDAMDSIFQNDPAALNDAKNNMAAMNNNAGEINTRTADELTNNPDHYVTMQEGIASSSHPDYYNDPIMIHSRDVFNNLTIETGAVDCTVTQQFTDTHTSKHSEDIRTCKMYNKPASCRLERHIRGITEINNCSTDQQQISGGTWGHAWHGITTSFQPVCTDFNVFADNVSMFFLSTNVHGDCCTNQGMITVPAEEVPDNTWRALPIREPTTTPGYYSGGHEGGNSYSYHHWDIQYKHYTWEYRNNVCEKDINGDWTGNCQIEVAVSATSHFPFYFGAQNLPILDQYNYGLNAGYPPLYDCPNETSMTLNQCMQDVVDDWRSNARDFSALCPTALAGDPSTESCWAGGHRFRCPVDGCVDVNGVNYEDWVAAGSSGSFVRDNDVGTVIHYYRDRITYIVDDDIIETPPGCLSEPDCRIEPEAGWAPVPGSILDETSTDTWECLDATNNYIYNSIPIDPTNSRLNGIFTPTRQPGWGPVDMFEGDNPDLVCYEARPRNRVCGPDLGGVGSNLGTVDLVRPDGTIETVPIDQDYLDQAAQNCDIYDQDPGCALLAEDSVLAGANGNPILIERTYDCGYDWTQISSSTEEDVTCVSDIPCVGGECAPDWEEKSDAFTDAAFGLSVLEESTHDMDDCFVEDPGLCKIFKGKRLWCKEAWGGAVDCCNNGLGTSSEQYLQAAQGMRKVIKAYELDKKAIDAIGQIPLPGENDVAGAWSYVQQEAKDVWKDASDAVRDGMERLSELFTSEAEKLAVEKGTEQAIANGDPGTAVEGVTAVVSTLATDVKLWFEQFQVDVYVFLQEQFGEAVADLFMSATLDKGTGQVTGATFGGQIAAAANFLMTAYTAYQLTMLALNMIYACEPEEMEFEQKYSGKTCTAVNKWCDDEKLGTCVVEVKGACCFETVLGRIIQEAAATQGVRPPFGSGDSMNCEALSINQLSAIDYDQIDPTEWIDLLTTVDVLPNGATSATDILGYDTLTRSGYMTQEEVDEENAKRQEARDKIAAQLNQAQLELSTTEDDIVQYNDLIVTLTQLIADEMAKPVYLRDLDRINMWQIQLDEAQDKLDIAEKDKVALESKIVQLQDAEINDINKFIPPPTTVDERIKARLDDGNPLEVIRNEFRQEMWHPTLP